MYWLRGIGISGYVIYLAWVGDMVGGVVCGYLAWVGNGVICGYLRT